jgi:hypothetical protein
LAAGVVLGMALSRRHIIAGLGTGASSLVVVAVLVATSGLGYAGYKSAIDTDLKQVQVVRQDLSQAATSGYHAEADVSTFTKAGAYLPQGFLAFALGPFPWTVRSARHLLGLFDAIVWWALLPSLWRGFQLARRRIGRAVFSMVAPAAAITVLFSLSIGNFGAVLRERMHLVVIALPVIALGLAARRRSVDPLPSHPELAYAPSSSRDPR